MGLDYRSAGVDIDAGHDVVDRIKGKVSQTFTPAVLTGLGGFGALFDLKELMQAYEHPVLVQSIDGVGTKTIVARMAGKYKALGHDLVSAAANDIVVLGAKPLTMLDYIANDRLQPAIIEELIAGMVAACCQNQIALVGGETAEMPNTYLPGEHDLVGVVTGVVEKDRIISGAGIVPGDKVYALASSGLHTNGFSLARKIFFDHANMSVDTYVDALGKTLGEALLEPHLNYTMPVQNALAQGIEIKGMAHITGGGLLENIPRILPQGCGVCLDASTWPKPPIFNVMRDLAQLGQNEMYRTFNMGVGLVFILDPEQGERLQSFLGQDVFAIGEVVTDNKSHVVIEEL
jgi:phosphoribosylformylglycinamidine cyclo-ligase